MVAISASSPISSTLLNSNSNSNSSLNMSNSNSNLLSLDSSKKKRVGKACDSCRLKKTKCNGKQPCERCTADNKICIYTERKKSKDKVYSSEYVELIDRRLSLVNKSLLKLCEMVKLNKTTELNQFINDLEYNQLDELSPISVNQAISLLVDEHELEVDRKEFSASTVTSESLNKAAIKSNLHINTKKQCQHIHHHHTPVLKNDAVTSPSSNNNTPTMASSPESLSPKSTDFSPAAYHSIMDNKNNSNTTNQSVPLGKIKEEETYLEDMKDPLLDQNFESLPLQGDYSTYETNSNIVSPIDELDDIAMMGFNSLDLGQFHSNSIGLLNNSNNIPTGPANHNYNSNSNNMSHNNSISSAVNSSNPSTTNLNHHKNSIQTSPLLQGSNNNNSHNSNNSQSGYFSPSSITSDSSVLMFDSSIEPNPMLLSTENSFLDNLSMSPPTSIVKRSSSSCSTIGSGSIKKIQHNHHNRSHSHAAPSASIANPSATNINQIYPQLHTLSQLTKSNNTISATSLDPSMVASLSNDLNMHYSNEEYVQF